MSGRRIFVGNLPIDTREGELEDVFYKFGPIKNIEMKVTSRPPAFAFIEFDDERDALDAVRHRDGYDFAGGQRLRVEISHGGNSSGANSNGGHPAQMVRRGGLGPNPYGPSRRTGYRVEIKGLPPSCSWQDLKDHMRKAGEVTFAQVFRDGDGGMAGIVDYANYDDMMYSLKNLDDTQFKNPFEKAFIRVKEPRGDGGRRGGYGGGGYRGGQRGHRSRSRSRSPYERDRPRRHSRSRSRSRSPRSDSLDRDRRRDRDRKDYSTSPSRSGS